jgi:Putative quorum-sensing-regulated virulence factor
MPFGKHKGHPIPDLPDAYLTWLVTIELHDPLRRVVLDELQRRALGSWRREDRRREPAASRTAAPPIEIVNELVGAGLRSLARKYHPDLAGGDTRKMQQINGAVDWLRERARDLA